MEQKLLFFDIDGTLITEGTGKIPESTKKAIKMAKEEGHLLFVNTGRTRTSLPEKITSLNFDGYVCGCGTNIFFGDQELLSAKLSNELAPKWQRRCEDTRFLYFMRPRTPFILTMKYLMKTDGWEEPRKYLNFREEISRK